MINNENGAGAEMQPIPRLEIKTTPEVVAYVGKVSPEDLERAGLQGPILYGEGQGKDGKLTQLTFVVQPQ